MSEYQVKQLESLSVTLDPDTLASAKDQTALETEFHLRSAAMWLRYREWWNRPNRHVP